MIIGRRAESKLLNDVLRDDQPHFIAVYGRRRVGKTFLIRESYDNRFTFQHAGLSKGTLKEQLFAFEASLKEAGFTPAQAFHNWLEAFEGLKDLLRKSTERQKIIFIDELSWMDTPKSDLMTALESFWNGWASARRDIVLIVCSSATSWMISKVIHNKGGLYNRLTEQIHLQPFTLRECEEYVRERGLILNREQILQAYMIFGGVPYYWKHLKKGCSLPQNIDQMFFSANAPLKNEFQYLYSSIFRNPEIYIRIIEALGIKKAGMTRDELTAATKLANAGSLTEKLQELESCGFIRKYTAFGKKKRDVVYQLVDHFTLFYYKFLDQAPTDDHFWSNQINTPAINTWTGLAFERVCMLHTAQIRQKLGITGVYTEAHSWRCKADPDKGVFGSQIDLLIVRKDQIINLCEMKYSEFEYTVTAQTDRDIRRKIHDLVTVTGTKYAVHPILVTPFGLTENAYAGSIQAVITLDDLFA